MKDRKPIIYPAANSSQNQYKEIDRENVKFASRLRYCIDNYDLKDIPARMQALDDMKSELTWFNYGNVCCL